MFEDPKVIAAVIGAVTGSITAIITLFFNQKKLKTEFATEFSVEKALMQFLMIGESKYRSFDRIRHHIGGFESNELRKLLVRAGAVRFVAEDGSEMWALRERVPEEFEQSRWKIKRPPINKVDSNLLFPGLFINDKDY